MCVVLSWWHNQCNSSFGLFDECITVPSGCQPSDQANCHDLTLHESQIYTHHHPLLLLFTPKADPFLPNSGE